MRYAIIRLLLLIERGFYMTDAYLAEHRGNMVERAEFLSKVYEVDRRLDLLEVNHDFR